MGRDEFRKQLKAKKEALASDGAKSPRLADIPKKGRADDREAGSISGSEPKTQVDEGQIMATAFAALSTGEIDVEWEQVQVVQTLDPTADAPAQPPPHGEPTPQASEPAPLQPQLDPSQWQGRQWAGQDFAAGQNDDLAAHDPFSKVASEQLTPQQHTLLARLAKLSEHEIQTLNLRHRTRAEAMDLLRRSIAQMRLVGPRYARIITGKGIGSHGAPILRQAVVHWCILQANEHLLQWTPEPETSREYGAILVDLQGPTAST